MRPAPGAVILTPVSLVGRFFGSRDDVPGWACFFDAEGYRGFLDVLDAEMKRRGLAYELNEGILRLPGPEPSEYGLLNLAQLCHASPRGEWPAVVARHFDNTFRFPEESREIDARAQRFEDVRSLLKVRIYHSDYLRHMGPDRLVHRVPAPGLVETLVYDLPSSVSTVPREHLRAWGRPEDELFALGLANVRAEGLLEPRRFEVEAGAAFYALAGDSFFTASHALFLGEYLGRPASEHGALVAVPHRHGVLYHPIADMRVVPVLRSMIAVAFGMYQEGPGSIHPGLYWWQEGRMTDLPSRVRARSIDFTPPEEFVALLNRLPE